MGEREVDRIIEQWRAEARAAGESAPPTAETGPVPRAIRRIGWLRTVAAVVAVCVFTVVAGQVLGGRGDPAPAQSEGPQPVAAAEDAPAAASPQPTPRSEPTAVAAAPDWFGLMRAVDDARSAAYSSADPARLEIAFAPDGPALARERAAVSALAAGGVRALGWRTELLSVRVVEHTADTATLGVADLRGGYDLVKASGESTPVPAASRIDWLVSLRKAGDRWLVVDATSQPQPP